MIVKNFPTIGMFFIDVIQRGLIFGPKSLECGSGSRCLVPVLNSECTETIQSCKMRVCEIDVRCLALDKIYTDMERAMAEESETCAPSVAAEVDAQTEARSDQAHLQLPRRFKPIEKQCDNCHIVRDI